jgi:hypothetical protein
MPVDNPPGSQLGFINVGDGHDCASSNLVAPLSLQDTAEAIFAISLETFGAIIEEFKSMPAKMGKL